MHRLDLVQNLGLKLSKKKKNLKAQKNFTGSYKKESSLWYVLNILNYVLNFLKTYKKEYTKA